jgi:hypothetical protein
MPPGESRYGEKEVKNALSEEVKGRFKSAGGAGGAGGGRGARACVRHACVHAPFDLPPVA